MSIYNLKNQYLSVSIDSFGAQLMSVVDIATNHEYIWQGDPQFWSRHAPVLFPIVGALKDNQYRFNNQYYKMGQHGFARDLEFTTANEGDSKITFELRDNQMTKKIYPFSLILKISYQISKKRLSVNYQVINSDTKEIYFSIGGHPGFNFDINQTTLSVVPGEKFRKINFTYGLTDPSIKSEFNALDPIDLDDQFFDNDAVILNTQDKSVQVSLQQNGYSVTVESNPAFLGIWSPPKKSAPFICVEPWWGVADPINSVGDITQKYAINKLSINEQFNSSFSMIFD